MKNGSTSKLLLLTALLVGVSLIGCGGGGGGGGGGNGGGGGDGGDGGDGGGGGGGQVTKTYLAYSGSLILVDPENLNNRVTVSNAGIDWLSLMAVNGWDPQTRTYSDLHRYETFIIENNKSPVYAVPLVKGSQSPQKRQISNINNACRFIGAHYDYVNKKAYLEVRTAGQNNTCGDADDRWFLINNTMSNSTAPIDITGKEILTSFDGGFQNPAISGFIALDNQNNIQKCDTNMQCTNIGQYSNNIEDVGTNPANGHIYLCIDGTLNLFNGQSLNSLGIQCGSFPDWDFYSDESGLYAKDPNGNIRKLNHGGNNWTTIYNGGDIDYISSSTNNYLLTRPTTATSGLIAIRKNDGSAVTLSDSGTGWTIPIGDKVFFDKYMTTESCRWTEGSSQPTCTNNAYIAGFTMSTHGTWSTGIHRILEVRNVDTSGQIPGGGTLHSVDPSTGNSIPLGQVPQNMMLFAIGIGKYTLVSGYDYNNNQADMLVTDVTQQNSLQRLTNTPNVDENIVF